LEARAGRTCWLKERKEEGIVRGGASSFYRDPYPTSEKGIPERAPGKKKKNNGEKEHLLTGRAWSPGQKKKT